MREGGLRGERGVPEKHRGMEMRNQRAMREKKAPRGMAPLLPVCTISTFSSDIMSRVMPGKYAAHLQATACNITLSGDLTA